MCQLSTLEELLSSLFYNSFGINRISNKTALYGGFFQVRFLVFRMTFDGLSSAKVFFPRLRVKSSL